jgi:parallel beta-helix repeat protein
MSAIRFRRTARAFVFIATVFIAMGCIAKGALAITPQCVSTPAALQAALAAAQTDHQPNLIAVVNGTYAFTTPLTMSVGDGEAITIEGGYTAGCASPPTPTPDGTIISGGDTSGTSVSLYTYRGGISVRNLSFTGFKPVAGTHAIRIGDSSTGDMMRVENVAISGNHVSGIDDNDLTLYTAGGLVFDDNIVHDNANANAAVYVYAQYPGLPITIANNTIANNQSRGLLLATYAEIPTKLVNNILWNNASTDLTLADCHVLALNNTWGTTFSDSSSALVPESANNDSTNPQLTATFRLAPTSPVINAGLPLPMALPSTDAADVLRVQGSAPDQGAYETATDDFVSHTYLVTNTNDSGILSLRKAITDANAAGVPARINFHIGSSCGPQTFLLSTPLPALGVPMLIDGYSQPGALANTAAQTGTGIIPFNATTCIVLATNASPNAGYGLRVDSSAAPNVHLEVRGIAFTLFANAAIDIAGGNGSWLHGNAFGESATAQYFANNIGVQLDGGVATVVGGPFTADVNLIGNSHSSDGVGIRVTSTSTAYDTIANNAIGSDGSGTGAAAGNAHAGIDVESTRQHIISDNWIVSNGGDGIRIDGSGYILVQANQIGSRLNGPPGIGNAGAGVHLLDGASNNWIGSIYPDVSTGTNVIEANGGAGVWIDVDALGVNQVTGNRIALNSGLAIDLGAFGPSPNTGNEGGGANYGIHKPVLTNANYALPGHIKLLGSIHTTPNNTRYVSVYASERCGDAYELLGTYVVQADAAGFIALSLDVPVPLFSPAWITATDDDYTAGVNDTSEVSNCKNLSSSDDIFNDAFDNF